MVKFSPSLLAADFSNLQEEIKKIAGADYLHLDIMDGIFVPNITFGPGLIRAIRPYSSAEFDTHLMIDRPERYIEEFARAGSDSITFHLESTIHHDRLVQQIKENNCQVGVALNPATPLNTLEYILAELDSVLLMTVNPGFGGQKFIPQMLDKIQTLREMIDAQGSGTKIRIDGGVNLENIREIARAGVDIIVAGSAIFKTPEPARTLKKMKELVKDL